VLLEDLDGRETMLIGLHEILFYGGLQLYDRSNIPEIFLRVVPHLLDPAHHGLPIAGGLLKGGLGRLDL
jgi:hypothetical protein